MSGPTPRIFSSGSRTGPCPATAPGQPPGSRCSSAGPGPVWRRRDLRPARNSAPRGRVGDGSLIGYPGTTSGSPGTEQIMAGESAHKPSKRPQRARSTVADVMKPPLTTVDQNDHVAAAAYLMRHAGATALV